MAGNRRTKASKDKGQSEAPPSDPGASDARGLLLRDVAAFNAWRRENLGVAIDLSGADLRGAQLREAFLVGATMARCQLDDAALAGAQLSGAVLDGASLVRADLSGACLGPAEGVSPELARSPVGSALGRAATLRGANLSAARLTEAELSACDLSGADLTDCDFTDANLTGARLDGPVPAAPPGGDEDSIDQAWERLGKEPKAVREGMLLFAMMVSLAGVESEESDGYLSGFLEVVKLTQDDVDRLMPKGPVQLEALKIKAPASHWAKRVLLVTMCGLAATHEPVQPMQLQVLGHFGEQLGFSDRAMARILSDELGMDLQPARPL